MSPPYYRHRAAKSTHSRRGRKRSSKWKNLFTDLSSRVQALQREQKFRQQRRKLFVLSLLMFFICILILALVPGQHRIETQLIVSQISFQTELPDGKLRRQFLNSVRNIESVSLTGQQIELLSLSGEISSPEIGRQTELDIRFPYNDKSSLQLKPILEQGATSPSNLELLSLELQDKTLVEALRYAPFSRLLELRFSHSSQPEEIGGSLVEFDLGQQPLELIIAGYQLPELGLEDPDGNQPLTLSFQPNIKQLGLMLPQKGNLLLSLPPLADKDTLRWFWNVPATRVAFNTEERRKGESLKRSAISSGSVRMSEQSLKIEKDQFLLLNNPGIQEIHSLQLIEGQGIEVRASGKTSSVQVGIDPNFPVRGLKSNVIARLFSPDVVVAIVSFSGAMVASILAWLIDNLFKE